MGPEYFWGAGMWFFPFIGIFVMLLVVYMIFGRSRYNMPCNNRDDTYKKSEPDPLDILKERYARGEISKEEFENIKKDILSS